MAIPIRERITENEEDMLRFMMEHYSRSMRVAIPGIIESFDPTEQTVRVQPAIRERVQDGTMQVRWVNLPLLLDVPIVLPRAGGFALTMPIRPGDECLVVFADMCIDAWWANGDIQNQIEQRRHDLSDAFAILGTWSQPRRVPNYAMDAAELRIDDGSAKISIRSGAIDIDAPTVRINGRAQGGT